MEHPPVSTAQIAKSGLARAHWHERKRTAMNGAALRHHLKQDEAKRKNGAGKRRVCLCRVPGYIDHRSCTECGAAYLPLLHEETAAAIAMQLKQHELALALTESHGVDYDGNGIAEEKYPESPMQTLETIPESDEEVDLPTAAHPIQYTMHTIPTLETGTVNFDENGVSVETGGRAVTHELTTELAAQLCDDGAAELWSEPVATRPYIAAQVVKPVPFGHIELVERLVRHPGEYGLLAGIANSVRDKFTTPDVQANTDNNPYHNTVVTKRARRFLKGFWGGMQLKASTGRRIDNTTVFSGKMVVPIFTQLYRDMQKIRQIDAPRANDRGAMARNLSSAIQFYLYQHKRIAEYQDIQFEHDGVVYSGSDIIHNTHIQLLSKYYIRDNSDAMTVGEPVGVPRE
jgi:hypothetical protein